VRALPLWKRPTEQVETTETSTKFEMMRKKERAHCLFDFTPSNLKHRATVQSFIAEELGVTTSCIMIGRLLL
jgi:hypothetical protein